MHSLLVLLMVKQIRAGTAGRKNAVHLLLDLQAVRVLCAPHRRGEVNEGAHSAPRRTGWTLVGFRQIERVHCMFSGNPFIALARRV